MAVIVVCMKSKDGSTLPWYEQNCPNFKHYKGLTYGMFKRMRFSIAVIEDAPLIMRTSRRQKVIESLVSALSRENRIFTIITTQYPKQLPTALTIECDVRMGDYFYRALEGRNATKWHKWTNVSSDFSNHFSPIVEAIYKGVKGKELGRVGRKTSKESFRQKCFAKFKQGLTGAQVACELGLESGTKKYSAIQVYYLQWKKRK